MHNYLTTLISDQKNHQIPDEDDYFGKLIGSWHITYTNQHTGDSILGEWHFSWILDGMAVQDAILLPGFEYGTTLRIYNHGTHAWDIAYGFTGKIIRLEAKRQDAKIVLTNLDDRNRKWVFVNIEDTRFYWQDVTVKDDGTWRIDYDIHAERIK